ncbi:MAG: hypothetical protein NW206_10220 [Hyphomonadaceae bacterium]|nr:hypothetical protein [Hyphomonadaceae bacterium]
MSNKDAGHYWTNARQTLSRVVVAGRNAVDTAAIRLRSPALATALAQSRLGEGLFGRCEGADGAHLWGWAWRMGAPVQHLEVEQWVDGILKSVTLANLARPDLEAIGMGDGAFGWRMPMQVELQSYKRQTVHVRLRAGPTLVGGVVQVLPVPPPPPPPPPPEPFDKIVGHCDGVDAASVRGWAWRPNRPEQRVEVEQWVDGVLRAKTRADLARTDLRDAGIGDGAHGWRMPLVLEADETRPQTLQIIVRERNLLADGERELVFKPASMSSNAAKSDERADCFCDRIEGGELIGWAWRPNFPEQQVAVEQRIDGVLAGETVANLARADLAKLGHGRYGWRMPLRLDPNKAGPQIVEVKVKGAGAASAVARLELTYDPSLFEPTVQDEPQSAVAEPIVRGRVDGLKGANLHGWAWNPQAPEEQVEVELWVDGEHKADTVANSFRADLRAGGIGHGRYGWRLPLALDANRQEPLKVEVRAKKTGLPLTDGVLEISDNFSLNANADLASFVTSALRLERDPSARSVAPPRGATTFILYCPKQRERGAYWAREFDDYPGAAKAFAALLRTLGAVIEIDTLERADAIYAQCVQRNEACILLSFAPPRLAPLDLQCPVVPAFAWAFPTIPTGTWDGDPRSDWRYVLRRTGRAIVFSEFAAAAVRAAMGVDFPVAAIAAPTFERGPPAPLAAQDAREISIDGVVFDSREMNFDPNQLIVAMPLWRGDEPVRRVTVDGVVFASVLDLDDGRKNWQDLVSAFAIGHAQRRDATLILKLSQPNADWWIEMYKWLAVMPKFDCRILCLRGDWNGEQWRQFVAASDWYVAASKAEGLCSPLQTFLSAGRPAIAPRHSALADSINPNSALIVDSDEEPWTWPDNEYGENWSWTQHPADVGMTTRQRPSWKSLITALEAAHQISTSDRARYEQLSDGAVKTMRALCSDAVVKGRLAAFLGLDDPAKRAAPAPSALLSASVAK